MIHVYHIAGQILSIKVLVTFLTVLKKEKFAFNLLIFANKQWQKIDEIFTISEEFAIPAAAK